MSTNLLGKSSGKSTGGNTTDEENEELEGMDDFEESGMMEYGDGQGGKDGDEEDEQIRKQVLSVFSIKYLNYVSNLPDYNFLKDIDKLIFLLSVKFVSLSGTYLLGFIP